MLAWLRNSTIQEERSGGSGKPQSTITSVRCTRQTMQPNRCTQNISLPTASDRIAGHRTYPHTQRRPARESLKNPPQAGMGNRTQTYVSTKPIDVQWLHAIPIEHSKAASGNNFRSDIREGRLVNTKPQLSRLPLRGMRQILLGADASTCRSRTRAKPASLVLCHAGISRILIIAAVCCTLLHLSAAQFHPTPNMAACPGERHLDGILTADFLNAHGPDSGTLYRPACVGVVPQKNNGPVTGSVSVLVEGANFGMEDRSPQIRVGLTACEATTWVSMTSMRCRLHSGITTGAPSLDGAIAVTILSRLVANPITASFTFDGPSISGIHASNTLTNQPSLLTVAGNNLGSVSHSGKMRKAATACESSVWVSETSLYCRTTSGGSATRQVQVTVGERFGTTSESVSYSSPELAGSEYDVRTYSGFPSYNPAVLPNSACSDGSADVVFSSSAVVGCDGDWALSSGGIEEGGRKLCGAGFRLCASAEEVQDLLVNATLCNTAPARGTLYATAETSSDGQNCSSDGTGGTGNGTLGLWGCGKDGVNVTWSDNSCLILSSSLLASAQGASTSGAWNFSSPDARTVGKGPGNGGVMCCRSVVPLPVGNLGGGIRALPSATGTAYVMYTARDAQSRFGSGVTSAERFVVVAYDEGSRRWEHLSEFYRQYFVPVVADLLVAALDLDVRTVSLLLQPEDGAELNGIAVGVLGGDMSFVIDQFAGSSEMGMLEVSGKKLLVSPDAVNLQKLPRYFGAVHARYTYQSWSRSPSGVWLDASGNGRDGVVTRGSVAGSLSAGSGATRPIGSVSGTVSDGIQFAVGSIPQNFTICAVSRYVNSGSGQGRILDAVDGDWFFGHDGGNVGVAGFSGVYTQQPRRSPSDDTLWNIICGTNANPFYFNARGVALQGSFSTENATNSTPSTLSINDGLSGQYSDWSVAEIVVWSEHLSKSAIDTFAGVFRSYLTVGTDVWDDEFSVRDDRWANVPTRGGVAITVAGMNMMVSDSSVQGRVGMSSCQQSAWVADTAMVCHSIQGARATRSLIVTAGYMASSISEAVSFEHPSLSAVSKANLPSSGSNSFTIQGASFGSAAGISVDARAGGTAAQRSLWLSGSSVACRPAAHTQGTQRVAMTSGQVPGTMTEALSFNSRGISNVHSTNLASTGSTSVTILGAGFAHSMFSGASRMGHTAAEATEWISTTHVRCRHAVGVSGTRSVALTQGHASSSVTEAVSYNTKLWINVTATFKETGGNYPTTGSVHVSLFGEKFASLWTHAVRLQGTSCEASAWNSDTGIVCLTSASMEGALRNGRVALSVGDRGGVASVTELFSFNEPSVISSVVNGNNPATASHSLTIVGVGLGASAWTPRGRVGASAAEATSWEADTAVRCSTATGISSTHRLALTVVPSFGSATETITYNLDLSCVLKTNSPATGSTSVTVIGSGLSSSPRSAGSRIAGSACEASEWQSESSIRCLSTRSIQGTLRIMVTAGIVVDSSTSAVSFDLAVLSTSLPTNAPATGSASVTVSGALLADRQLSSSMRRGKTSCEASNWMSESSLVCRVITFGHGNTLPVGLTVGQKSVSLTEAASFDSFLLSLALSANYTTNVSVTLTGNAISPSLVTPAARLQFTASEASDWQSDSSIVCRFTNDLIFGSLGIAVTAGRRTFSFTEGISYSRSFISTFRPANIPLDGGVLATIYGSLLGQLDTSTGVRIGGTPCEATSWQSMEALVCRSPFGFGGNALTVATAGVRTSSLSSSFTFDAASITELITDNGNTSQWPLTTLPNRWAGTRSGQNTLTVQGSDFGAIEYSAHVQVGAQLCENTTWVSTSTVLCQVPRVPIWGNLTANDTLCSTAQGCRVDHLVTLSTPGNNLSTFDLSYVYACQCDGTQCYDHSYEQGANATYCEDVNECNTTLCDGTTCPPNNCDLNAVCSNTNGSFTCTCPTGFSAAGSVGSSCVLCPVAKYKDSAGNTNCTHCGTYSPRGSTNYSSCEQPLLRYAFELSMPLPGSAVPNIGTAGSILDGTLSIGALTLTPVDGQGGTKAFEFISSASGDGSIHLTPLAFVTQYQQAWANVSSSRNSFTVAYWIKAAVFRTPSFIVEFDNGLGLPGSAGVYLSVWHTSTETQMIVSDGNATCCPGSSGSILTAPAISLGQWIHVALTFSVQKYPVRNSTGQDATALEVAYGYGTHHINETHSWEEDLVEGYSLGGARMFDEERGDALLLAVARIDETLPWAPDKYGGTWMCATQPYAGVFFPVRLLLGGQVECYSNSSGLCNTSSYLPDRGACQASLADLERTHVGFRTDPSPDLAWTADFVDVRYSGYASNATYDEQGEHSAVLGEKARVQIQHPVAFQLHKYKIYCGSWRVESCPGLFTMEVSADGAVWQTLGQEGPVTAAAWEATPFQTFTLASPGAEGAYYRLTIDELAGSARAGESGAAFAQVGELELWGEEFMRAYYDGAPQAAGTVIDGTEPLPGSGAPMPSELRSFNLDGEAQVDDFQFWTSALNDTEIGYLQYADAT